MVTGKELLIPNTVGELAAAMRSLDEGASVGIQGCGSNPDRFMPEVPDVLIDTTGLQEMQFRPEEFTVTVGAGVPFDALQARLALAKQCVKIEPPAKGTVGAALATAAHGPLIYRYGGVRDQVIGMTLVLTDGSVAHSGGKVIKNVAGYDLARFFVGSRGRLGVVAGAVLRTYPLPESRLVVEVADPPEKSPLSLLRRACVDPVGIEALNNRWYLLLEGSAAHVQSTLSVLERGALGEVHLLGDKQAAELRSQLRLLRTPEEGGAVYRFYSRPRDCWSLYKACVKQLDSRRITSHLGSGLTDLRIPPDFDRGGMERLHDIGAELDATLAWRAGNARWASLVQVDCNDSWETEFKAQLDPGGHLSKRMGERDGE